MNTTSRLLVCVALLAAGVARADAPDPTRLRTPSYRPAPRSKKTIAGGVVAAFSAAFGAASIATAATYGGSQLLCGLGSDGDGSSCSGVGLPYRNAAIGTGVASAALLALSIPLLVAGRNEERDASLHKQALTVGAAPIFDGGQGATGMTMSLGGRF